MSTSDFDTHRFNHDFQLFLASRKTHTDIPRLRRMGKEASDKLKQDSEKNIFKDESLYNIFIKVPLTIQNIIDDMIQTPWQRPGRGQRFIDIITKEDRLFYLGFFFVVVAVIMLIDYTIRHA